MRKIERDQSFAAVPSTRAIREKHPLENGGVRLVVDIPTSRIQQKILRLPATTQREFELDGFGREVLENCDGRNSVVNIIGHFANAHRMHPHESEKAVLTFLRTLVAKGILSMAVPDCSGNDRK